MTSASPKKKFRVKPPKSRPHGTSALSQPSVNDSVDSSVMSAFSPGGDVFAFLSLAMDKHRLRVYNTSTGKCTAEHLIEGARVTSLTWVDFEPTDVPPTSADEAPTKRRKKREMQAQRTRSSVTSSSHVQVVALGLSNGTSQFFSLSHGRVLRTLTHSSCTAAILAIASDISNDGSQIMWTSASDSVIRSWNAAKNEILGSWKNDDRISYSALTVRPGTQADAQTELLVASHGIHLLSTPAHALVNLATPERCKERCSFTGHTSTIKSLIWDGSASPPFRFFSIAEDDRFAYLWNIPSSTSGEGLLAASIPLDSDACQISVGTSSQNQILLALSASGKVTVSPIPGDLSVPQSTKKPTTSKIPSISPQSTIQIPTEKNAAQSKIIAATFVSDDMSRIRLVRSTGGVKLTFHVVKYLDDSGQYIPEVKVDATDGSASQAQDVNGTSAPRNRYSESAHLAVGTGEQMGHDPAVDDAVTGDIDGDLDVDLAELSLGQRLTALSGLPEVQTGARSSGSDREQEQEAAPGRRRRKKEKALVVPANSLTRTLIQALHSSDAGLLETCLAHSDETLIQNTIRRLPPQLAVPLLNACVERLGRGARARTMKGRGGGASSQRGMGLIAWVKAVLAVHSGHLMTMPDLVARLAGLHGTLTTRLTLQERLMSLSGRLDLVLSQSHMRSSAAPAPLTFQKKGKAVQRTAESKEPQLYIEGESSNEEEKMDAEVEVDEGEDNGSVEDIELGGDSQEEDGTEDENEDEDSDADSGEEVSSGDDDGDYSDKQVNGFIDGEAEEDYGEDESDEDSE
ncbi:NUC189-domain-containing protein [Rickenella mellea]|uniref:NUC189-domain-containing protein n=1 Tax=Rickenella mellea TaxID=50990 RepID=A0A4Y7QNM0_9AGAM|nr:NUC189-domain-containing protein [Rickenella mellea]